MTLGLEQTGGFETVAFCEIDPFARRVLAKHWPPEVVCYHDIRNLTVAHLYADGFNDIDIITAGFPCTDISLAGPGGGLSGKRSGLWSEAYRLIEEIRPNWAIIENVSALRNRGLGEMLRQLAEIGYDAVWNCIPAAAVGAGHRRDRIWIVAHTMCDGLEGGSIARTQAALRRRFTDTSDPGRWEWPAESRPFGVAARAPNRVHRLRVLGNAVVPEIPRRIGLAILDQGK